MKTSETNNGKVTIHCIINNCILVLYKKSIRNFIFLSHELVTVFNLEKVKAFLTKFGIMNKTEKEENKQHSVHILTKEEQQTPSQIELPAPDKPPGLILDDGSINWNCPCLGSMVSGPCGVQFRTAFSCFHYSEAEPKGSDCADAFSKMHECMQKYPTIYGPNDQNEDDDLFALEQTESKTEMTNGIGDPNPVVDGKKEPTSNLSKSKTKED